MFSVIINHHDWERKGRGNDLNPVNLSTVLVGKSDMPEIVPTITMPTPLSNEVDEL